MKPDIDDLFRQAGGAIRTADHPELRQRLARLRRAGELSHPLPGVLCQEDPAENFELSVLAGQLWAGRDAVLTASAAARLTFWKDCPAEIFTFASPCRFTDRHGSWRRHYRRIPPEHTRRLGSITVTAPAMTAIDLATGADGGDAIDRVLRSRQARLDHLWAALRAQPNRPGNKARAELLRDSRDKPWSEGERKLHRLMRDNRIVGWKTNVRLLINDVAYYPDVLFDKQRLIIEFDGWEFHRDRETFDNDRLRRNELVLAGYRVLNFTWTQLIDDPEWVIDCIRRALDGRRR